jgi:hypothetical protein
VRCGPAAAPWPAHGGHRAGGDTLQSARRLQRMASRASSLPSYTGSHPPVQVKTKGTGRRIWLRLAGSHLRPPRHLAAPQSVGLQSAADAKAGRQAGKRRRCKVVRVAMRGGGGGMPVLQADRLLHRALLGIFAICQHANGWGGTPHRHMRQFGVRVEQLQRQRPGQATMGQAPAASQPLNNINNQRGRGAG